MAVTIEDVESRTLLQQFHALYEKQKNYESGLEDVAGDIAQEIQDRTDADYELSQDIAGLQAQLDALGNVFTLKGSVATVGDLPATNNNIGDVWYVIADSSGYVWIDDNDTERWEQLGRTVDLSNYATQSDLSTGLATKQDTLTAGTNISIIGTTISATQPDTSKYEMLTGVAAPSTSTAGAVGQKYLDTTNNDVYICTAKVDNGDDTYSYTWLLAGGNAKQNKLTAGTNISIDANNVISASGGGSANAVTLDTTTQTFDGSKTLQTLGSVKFKKTTSSYPVIEIAPNLGYIYVQLSGSIYTQYAQSNITRYVNAITSYHYDFPNQSGTIALTSDISVYGCSIEVTNASGIPFLACINGRWTEYNTTISLSNCSEIIINNAGGHFDETTGFVNVDFDFYNPDTHLYVTNNSATVTILAGAGGN